MREEPAQTSCKKRGGRVILTPAKYILTLMVLLALYDGRRKHPGVGKVKTIDCCSRWADGEPGPGAGEGWSAAPTLDHYTAFTFRS